MNVPICSPRKHILSGLLLTLFAIVIAACSGPTAEQNMPPVADAGPASRSAVVGTVVVLDASASTDPDGDALSYGWEMTASPSGSDAELASPEEVATSFTPDIPGSYLISLTVSDGMTAVSQDLVVNAGSAPLAAAGADRTVDLGDLVELDGSASSGPEGVPLVYNWALLSQPDTSTAVLQNDTSASPRFTPDVRGQYRVELTVSAGVATARDTVVVNVNAPPEADAGQDHETEVGQAVNLSGLNSTDPDGDPLTYSWAFVAIPAGSTAEIEDADQDSAVFTPLVEGDYVVELTVNDGRLSDSSRATITVQPVGGAVRTALYLAPDGDDAGSGDVDAPLSTLGAALAVVEAEPTITRINLASGTYDTELYDYEITADLQIVGPSAGTAPAVLAAPGRIFDISTPARLTLLRVSLRSQGSSSAIFVRRDARIVLTESTCSAQSCISAGTLTSGNGGSVLLNDSQLTGTGTTAGTGVSSFSRNGVAIVNSTISNFATGVNVLNDQSLSILDSDLRDNDTAVRVGLLASGLIQESRLRFNTLGLLVTLQANLVVQQSEISDGAKAATVHTGASLVLNGVDISASGPAMDLGMELGSLNEQITMRDSTVHSGGTAIVVGGDTSILDLGTATDEANNQITGVNPVQLLDDRPQDSGGVIQLNGTTLGAGDPAAGTFTGPDSADGWRIMRAGNVIIVH